MDGLCVLDQERLDDRDAYRCRRYCAGIRAEDRGALREKVPRQGREGDDRQRREDQAKPEPLQQPGRDQRPLAHLQREPGHLPQRDSAPQPEPAENITRRISTLPAIRATRNIAATIVPMPRGAVTNPAVSTGVVHQRLHHRRQQRHRAVKPGSVPIRNIKTMPPTQFEIAEEPAVETRAVAGGRRVADEQVEAEKRDRPLDPDLGRARSSRAPGRGRAASAGRRSRGSSVALEAEEVEGLALCAPPLVDEDRDPGRGETPGRHVEVEDPAPVVIVGQPAAERFRDR